VGYLDATDENLNGTEVCRIILPNTSTNRTLIASDVDASLQWDDGLGGMTDIFIGTCTGAKHTKGELICNVIPTVYYTMFYKDITAVYNGVTCSTILAAVASAAGVNYSWTAGSDPTVSVRFARAACLDAAKFLADIAGADVWGVKSTNTIHVGTRGSAKGALAILPEEESTRIKDRQMTPTKVYVRGVDANGSYIEGSYGPGTKIRTFTERKAADVATLNLLAQRYYNELNTDDGPSAINASQEDTQWIIVGDTVPLSDAELGLSGSYKITRLQRRLDLTIVAITSKVKTVEDRIIDLKKYEEMGIYPISIGQIPKSLQTWNSNLVFTAVDWDTATWGAGTITFADATTLAINAGSTGDLGSAGTYYVYFTIGSATLTVTSDYAAAKIGLIAKLTVSSDTSQKIGIETFGAKGTKIIKDHIAEDSIFAAAMRPGIQPYESTVEFYKNRTDHAGSNHADIHWHAGTIVFADGSSQAIDAGQKTGMVDLDTWYLYFSLGSTTLQATDNYANVTGNTVGLLCKAYVSVDPDQDVSFHAIAGKRSNWISDFVGAKAINTIHIDTDSIYGKDIATQALVGIAGGNAGIRIIGDLADIITTPTLIGDAIGGNFTAGIWGFKSGPLARTFFFDPATGKISVYGAGNFRLVKDDGTLIGTLDMTVEGGRDAIKILTVGGTKDIILESGGYVLKLRGDGDIDILGNAVLDVSGARLLLPLISGDPPSPRNGDIWIDVS